MLYSQTLRLLLSSKNDYTYKIDSHNYVFYCLIHSYTTRSFLVFKNYYRDLMAASPRQNSKLFCSVQ